MKVLVLAAALTMSGCAYLPKAHDFLKDVEGKAYDSVATTFSKYCKRGTGHIITQERLELRREIRQRGRNGPDGQDYPGLDGKTAYGSGPVIRIWCEDEEVPAGVWGDFVRE